MEIGKVTRALALSMTRESKGADIAKRMLARRETVVVGRGKD